MSRYTATSCRLQAKPLGRGTRIASDLTAETARQHVAALMSDGRERTGADVATRIGIPKGQASAALGWLSERGMLSRDMLNGGGGPTLTIYRRRDATYTEHNGDQE